MTIQIPVLDDRSYDQLVAEARARIPVHTPEWTNLNASDPGITVLELFAYLTDNLLYRSNRIPEANRVKFLTMLGISLLPPTPGRGLVAVTNSRGQLDHPQVLPAGTEMRAGQVRFATTTGLAVLPVTAQAYYKQPQRPDDATLAQYRLLYQTFLESDADQLSFYAPVRLEDPATGMPDPVVDLGDTEHGTIDRSLWLAVLAPRGVPTDTARRLIGGQSLSIGVQPAAVLDGRVLPAQRIGAGVTDPGLVVEIAAPENDPSGLSGPGFGIGAPRYTRLQPTYADPVLEAPGVLQVVLPPYDDLLLWSFDPEEEGTGDYPPRVDDADVTSRLVTWIRLRYLPPDDSSGSSTSAGGSGSGMGTPGDCGCGCGESDAMAITGTTVETGRLTWAGLNAARVTQVVAVEREALGLGTGTPFQAFTLANTPVVSDDEHPMILEVRDTGGAWVTWPEIDDIFAAGPDEPVFCLDRATGRVVFGNGLAGLRPPRGAAVRASYAHGGGPAGQVPIGAIDRSVALPGGFTVTNPVPTWGAGSGESPADGEAAVTAWLRHRDRLVTGEDFTDLTRRTPGVDVGRVDTLPLFHPQLGPDVTAPGVVTLLVVPRSDPLRPLAPRPDRQFLDAVCRWLDPRRLITTELHVRGPVYQQVWVSVGVVCLPGQIPAKVEQAVSAAVSTFLSPLTGGLDGAGWPLGVAVRTQDIEAVATRVPGVRYVDSVIMASAAPGGAVVSPVTTVPLTGIQLPEATVLASTGPAVDPAATAQPVTPATVPVPVVPPTC